MVSGRASPVRPRTVSGLPFARAVVRDDTVFLHRWSPHLITGGPCASALRRVEATLADLTRLPEDELVVTPITPGDATSALARWAAAVGYRRIWLPGTVLDLDPVVPALEHAHVRCRGCGAEWDDGRFGFWETVRRRGSFPSDCLACGGTLPQWSTDRSNVTGANLARRHLDRA